MSNDHDAYKQVALTLATHFDGLYYVDIKTGSYTEFVPMLALKDSLIPSKGKNFFKVVADTAKKCVHPDDIDEVLKYLDKKTMLKY